MPDLWGLIDLRAILIVILVFVPLELILPLRREQKLLRKGWLNDAFYLFFNSIPIKLGFATLLIATLHFSEALIPQGLRDWVGGQNLAIQALAVTMIADFGFYCAHRTFHAVPFLWRFHAVHHSIEEMDWLAAHRVHPVDQILTMSASLLPVYALGFSDQAVLVYAIIYHWQSLLIHSNVRLDFGPLKWLVASPQFHHWHHANQRSAYDKNFAGQLPFIDWVMGTLRMPDQMPSRYGVDDPVPSLYHQQLIYPLQRNSVEAESNADLR